MWLGFLLIKFLLQIKLTFVNLYSVLNNGLPIGVNMPQNKDQVKKGEIALDFMNRDSIEFVEIEESSVDKAMMLTGSVKGKANCL